MSGNFSADAIAVLKILLHAAKHPACSVNGILVGKASEGTVSIVDAVPLFHTALSLSTPLEVALSLIDAHLQAQGDFSIVGYYQADAQYGPTELGKTGKAIADKLDQTIPGTPSCVLLLDNTKLADMIRSEDTLPFKCLVRKSGNWEANAKSGVSCPSGNVRSIFLEKLQQNAHRQIVDFDEHLDDVSRDFMNPDITA